MSSTRRPRSSGSICRPTRTRSCRSRTTACAAATTSTSSSPASSRRSTYLSMDDAILHCTRGIGIWDWASNDGGDPDVVLACCGDVPTLEALAAVALLREHLPELRVRFVNVVDLMRLQDEREHPHGLSRPRVRRDVHDRPTVIFAYHGYPWLIHRLTYRRDEPRQYPRPRVQGGGHGHDAVRHGHAQRSRPLPPRDRRHRPGSRPGLARRGAPAAPRRRARSRSRLCLRVRRGSPEIRDWTWPPDSRLRGTAPSAARILVLNAGLEPRSRRPCSNLPALDPVGRDEVDLDRGAVGPRSARRRSCASSRRIGAASPTASIDAVGHRVVHGGDRFTAPTLIDDERRRGHRGPR